MSEKQVKQTKQDFIFELVREEFGEDVIIVWKPKEVGKYMTTSSLLPSETISIITDLAKRFGTN